MFRFVQGLILGRVALGQDGCLTKRANKKAFKFVFEIVVAVDITIDQTRIRILRHKTVVPINCRIEITDADIGS